MTDPFPCDSKEIAVVSPLAQLVDARASLERARYLPDVKAILDVAVAAQRYAEACKLGDESVRYAQEIVLRATRRMGEILTDMPKQNGARDGKQTGFHGGTPFAPKLADLGIGKGQSHRAQKIAAVPETEFETFIDTARELTQAGVLKQAKQRHTAALVHIVQDDDEPPGYSGSALSGTFATIVADPPWRYGNTSTRGAAADHYPTMGIDELCDLSVVNEHAADESHLYLWATAGHLPDAFRVMAAWGFEYKTYLVWVKPQMGMGNYFRISTELVIFGIRGGLRTADRGIMNYFTASRSRHSAKPGVFRDIVKKASPGPYLELFARCRREQVLTGCECSRCMDGWTVWGNEAVT